MSATITVRSNSTGAQFNVQFPTADMATDWIIGTPRDIVLVDVPEDVQWNLEAWDERDMVYCSICDGAGHGQPGHGPCPLEDRGWMDTAEEDALRLRY